MTTTCKATPHTAPTPPQAPTQPASHNPRLWEHGSNKIEK